MRRKATTTPASPPQSGWSRLADIAALLVTLCSLGVLVQIFLYIKSMFETIN